MIEQLILVRHGETEHNVAGIAQGWNDSALSARGQRQVQKLAQRLASSGADAIYSSPLGRAMSTAEAIAATTGLHINVVDELREMSYGEWENRSFLDVRANDPDSYHRWIGDPDFACPGGESHSGVRERAEVALRRILGFGERNGGSAWDLPEDRPAELPNKPIVVSHGTAIRITTTALLELPLSAARHVAQDNASLNIFLWRGDRWVLKLWNDTTHYNEA